MKTLKKLCFKTCPKSGRIRGLNSSTLLFKILFPITGLVALAWVLIRIVPKPSRISYPCMQIAAPHAGLFLSYLAIISASILSFKKFRQLFNRRVYVGAAACLFVSFSLIAMVTRQDSLALAPEPVPNAPIGIGQGLFPGRVVWSFDREATQWPGRNAGHWWENEYTDQVVVDRMYQEVLEHISGETDAAQGWDQIFRYFNQKRGKGDVGYQLGEGIMIKVNFVGFLADNERVDSEAYTMTLNKDTVHVCPQVILSTLRQLVYEAGVPQEDIIIGDVLSMFPKEYYDLLAPEFPEVNYLDFHGGNEANPRVAPGLSTVRMHWSSNPTDVIPDYITSAFTDTAYNINIANLKTHGTSGITFCAKNHYGSMTRRPIAEGYYQLHDSLAKNDPEYGKYRALVDLMGHSDMGGKTLLYLVDGLYGGRLQDPWPSFFQSAPFNGDWSSSLFGSQDIVALESVLLDFMRNEWPEGDPNMTGSDDYLIEAALADAPPSGTFYDPDGNGLGLSSLGVHEHWNNPEEKLYSINLGYSEGIELVSIASDEAEAFSFTLINTDTGEPISHYNPIPEGAIINLASIALPENLSIRANTYPADGLDKVAFRLNGALANVDTAAPYTLTKDLIPWELTAGSYELFTYVFLDGIRTRSQTLNFTLIDEPVIEGFCLMDADTDLPVPGYELLEDGITLNLADLPENINFQAITDPANLLDRAVLLLDGTTDNIDRDYPYSFGLDYDGDYQPFTNLVDGATHQLKCRTILNGDILSFFDIDITVINEEETPDAPLLMEAEEATIVNGTIKSRNDASGDLYVDGQGGFNITWMVDDSIGGSIDLTFVVKAVNPRSMGVFVNDAKIGVVDCTTNVWQELSIAADLVVGANTIELRDTESCPEFDVDYLIIAGNDRPPFVPGEDVGIRINCADYDAESDPDDENRIRNLGTKVRYIKNGTWIAFNDFDFGSGASSFTIDATCNANGGTIELRLDSPVGPVIGSVLITETGGWNSYTPFSTESLTGATGIHTLYLNFVNTDSGAFLFDVMSFQFD